MSVNCIIRDGKTPKSILVSDLDHTMVQNEDATHTNLLDFDDVWHTYFGADSVLVFSTGRSPRLFLELWQQTPLLLPDVLICSVGSEVFYRTEDGAFVADSSWSSLLDQGWDRVAARAVASSFSQLTPQASSEQRPHKLSYHIDDMEPEALETLIKGLQNGFTEKGLRAKVVASSGTSVPGAGKDLDILAEGAGKGKALQFLLEQLDKAVAAAAAAAGETVADTDAASLAAFRPYHVQVNGDSGNDAELFQVPGVRGCVVANAQQELLQYVKANPGENIYLASEPCSRGIVEALRHFGSIPETMSDESAVRAFAIEVAQRQSILGDDSVAQDDPGYLKKVINELCQLAEAQCMFIGCKGERITLSQIVAAASSGSSTPAVNPSTEGAAGSSIKEATDSVLAQQDAGAGRSTLNWVDDMYSKQLSPDSWLVAYQLWSHRKGARVSDTVVQCTAIVHRSPDARLGCRLVHLHESYMHQESTATAVLTALVGEEEPLDEWQI